MLWYIYLAYFFGGAFIANAIPHVLMGIARRPFPTPFASPPFRGLSSPPMNIIWACLNFAVAYCLLALLRPVDIRQWAQVASALAGFTVMGLVVARSLKRLRPAAH